jgi:predicted DNA-binding transcriptional regulator YafY
MEAGFMPGMKNQKLKTLYLIDFLEKNTDAEHGVTTENIIGYLGSLGISAERKSVYSDIEMLRLYGLDVELVREGRSEYRLMSRKFQLPELKLLVDAVSASRFITRKKSLELIKKLEDLASVYEARQLRRNVYVDNRIKSMNESIYYSVDAIHQAINGDRMLCFRYFSYTMEKEREFRRDGEPYNVSPVALTFSDGNYYLYACDHDIQPASIRTYRVDRMTDTRVGDGPRILSDVMRGFDPAVHTNEMFSMYGGEKRAVTMSFARPLATVVLDRFGQDVMLVPDGEHRFSVTVDVLVSPTFLGWVFGFGEDVRIKSPKEVAARLVETAKTISEMYR